MSNHHRQIGLCSQFSYHKDNHVANLEKYSTNTLVSLHYSSKNYFIFNFNKNCFNIAKRYMVLKDSNGCLKRKNFLYLQALVEISVLYVVLPHVVQWLTLRVCPFSCVGLNKHCISVDISQLSIMDSCKTSIIKFHKYKFNKFQKERTSEVEDP